MASGGKRGRKEGAAMIYLEPPGTDPYFNLALEEYVFEQMDRSRAYFMLWQNSNTIVVGKYQNTAEEINQAFVDAHGIRVVRRLSGGGAVYHDTGNLNFTFIVASTSRFLSALWWRPWPASASTPNSPAATT